nr:MAG TPA: hypothetical protein [Bacteriophage sp.]
MKMYSQKMTTKQKVRLSFNRLIYKLILPR